MKLYIDKKALYGFVVALFILILLGYFSYRNNNQFMKSRELIFHATRVLNHIEQTQTNSVRVEEILAKYILTGDSSLLESYNKEVKKATTHYKSLVQLIGEKGSLQVKIDSFKVVGKRKFELHKKIMNAYKSSRQQAELMLNSHENRASSDKIALVLANMREEENRLLTERLKNGQIEIKYFQATFSVMMVFAFLILVAVFLVINRSFKLRLLAEEKASIVNQDLESFTYSVSHDLRAPLRSIRGFTEVLREEYGPTLGQEGNRLLSIVIRNAGRMGLLIDDLLDFSRLGRKTLTFSKIQVRELVTEIIQELTVHTPREVKWEVKHLDTIRADANMIRQVWINLISNALKYTLKVDKPVIEIGSFPKYGTTVYYVKDNGVGFDMKYSDKLFKVFQRLHNNQEFEGTGVGLALVQRIISKHNGKIWAEARVNEGASFFFYLNNPTV
ncbi:MAG TPA: ATP-binding protein [Cyclobacteriaceae bacterium]|nr:CHASE3 domain-containing protein [Cyclobacteriaceae bacterium]HRK55387.1 ATP-binding protein [Cyclobacteriaceae bacterium]